MKERLTVLAIALFAGMMMCYAQGTKITGKVFDKTNNEAMPFASVALVQNEGNILTGAMTNADGLFEIDASQGSYRLKVSYLGYKESVKDISATTATFDAGTIFIEEEKQMLGEVVVKSQRPKTQLKGDALVTNVAGSVLEHSGNANDVLAKVPGMISMNGKLEVIGRGEPQYYINGRKVTDASELRNLMSEDIQSIDVVSNPGALYGGDVRSVVRIKTVKRQGDGFSYALTSQAKKYTTCKYFDPSWTVLDINYRTSGWDFFGKLVYWAQHGFQASDIVGSIFLNKNGMPQTEIQDGRMFCNSYQGGLQEVIGANWQINSNHSLGFKVERGDNLFGDMDLTTESDYIINGTPDDHIYSVNKQKTPYSNQTTGNIYYDGTFNKLNINFNADFLIGNIKDKRNISEVSHNTSSVLNSTAESTAGMAAAKLVLSYPIWKGSLQAGVEETYFDGNEQYTIDQPIVPNTDYKARENTIAEFAQYSLNLPVGQMTAGLRHEYVDFKYTDYITPSKNLDRKQHDWFPSLSISTKIGGLGLSLSYTGKTIRPGMHSLSSELTYINRYAYQTGDPTLLSEKQRTASLQGAWKWLTFSATYEQVKNGITQWASPYNDEGVVIVRYSNVKDTYSKFSMYVSAAPTIGLWQPRYTIGYAKPHLDLVVPDIREATGSRIVSRNKPMYIIQANNAFQLDHNWQVELNYQFTSKMSHEIVDMTKPLHNLDLSLQKSFLKDNALTFNLTWTDILNRNIQHIYSDFGNYTVIQTFDYKSPGIVLRASYRFNSAQSKYKGTGAGQSVKDRM